MKGEIGVRGVCVFCLCGNTVAEQSDNEGERKKNMIEWDILSGADVSWSLNWGRARVCVCL